ncbi:MAG: DUF3383 domain-containing protein [Rhodospirillaceae bacterium]|nr:DUF3383 domain-containing protein [Rhodospirillaceae bacterium]
MSISADQIVSITPQLLEAGSSALELNGLILTRSAIIPAGRMLSFPDAASVGAAFGTTSAEYALAARYFLGFTNSDVKPQTLLAGSYIDQDVAGWLRGGAITIPLATLKAVTAGALSLVIDSETVTVTGLNLSAAASYSAVADILQTALDAELAGVTVTYSSLTGAFQVTSPTTGENSGVGYAASPSGDLAGLLNLTAAAGAIVSDGMLALDAAGNMENLLKSSRNWVTFSTAWEPDIEVKLSLSAWNNGYAPRFAYLAWDTDATAEQPLVASDFGSRLAEYEYAGTCPLYGGAGLAAFVMGSAASIDLDRLNGRITFAFKRQDGQVVTCDDGMVAQTLIAKGYNFYGDYATANDSFRWFYPGSVSGVSSWLDTYLYQVCIKNDLQLALMDLFATAKSLPYSQIGYGRVRASCLDPINKYKNHGAIVPGVTLSEAQRAEIVARAGTDITPTINAQGWYLQILDATPANRAARKTPVCNFWYADGGSIQQIQMSSIAIQ